MKSRAPLSLFLIGAATADDPKPALPPGTKLAWARLKSDSPFWDRHADYDHDLLSFMRENTTLNLDPVWHYASAHSIDSLCAYPFILAANLDHLAPDEHDNLVEYLRRGGFLLLDACLEPTVTPDPREFVVRQVKFFESDFPQLEFRLLTPAHPLFSVYFKLDAEEKRFWGLYDGDRMIALISLGSIECDLAGFGRMWTPVAAAKMITNIYLYALVSTP